MLKVCVTGHRPQKIGGYDETHPTRVWVKDAIREVVGKLKPNYAYTGLALGVDQDFANVCIEEGIPFEAVLPFQGQESKWPEASKFIYWRLIKKARLRRFVCDPGYAAWKLQRRNEDLVDSVGFDGVVIAVWDGSQSGTANCVRYAHQCDVRVIRINPSTKEIIY